MSSKAESKIYVFWDNGSSGTIGAISGDGNLTAYLHVPTYVSRDYNSSKVKNTTHLDYEELIKLFKHLKEQGELIVAAERPLKNPRLFNATMSGIRAHEVMLCVLRSLDIPLVATFDSRHWQEEALGPFEKGESKPRSLEVGVALFPEHERFIRKHGDADGILGAYIMRKRDMEGRNMHTGEKKGVDKTTSIGEDAKTLRAPKARSKKQTKKETT